MRDPARIDPIIEKIRRLWKQYPDLRLGQLFDRVKSLNQGPVDAYYVEDHEWNILLRMEVGEESPQRDPRSP